jgi:uncharacterized membrane protein
MIEIAHDVNFVKVKAIDTMVKMVVVVLCSVLPHLFLLLFFAVELLDVLLLLLLLL